MPERVALSRITIGEGKDRRMVMPYERFNISDEQAAEIDSYDPPIAVDLPTYNAMAQARPPSSESDDAVRQVAEPAAPLPPARAAGNGNTTREKPADDKEEL